MAGSSPAGSTSKNLSEKRDFYFCAEHAYLLYKLAVLLELMRFELKGDHLARFRKLQCRDGLDWREMTFWFVVRM